MKNQQKCPRDVFVNLMRQICVYFVYLLVEVSYEIKQNHSVCPTAPNVWISHFADVSYKIKDVDVRSIQRALESLSDAR